MNLDIPESLENIVHDISDANGMALLVGGAVIDTIQGRPIKDWDVEVYKLSLQQLEDILGNHGKTDLVGKSFGIIKVRINGDEYDFSVPRKENKIGLGHKDFDIELTPNISPEEAARRREQQPQVVEFRAVEFDVGRVQVVFVPSGEMAVGYLD